jgi:hypothetical protein
MPAQGCVAERVEPPESSRVWRKFSSPIECERDRNGAKHRKGAAADQRFSVIMTNSHAVRSDSRISQNPV